MTYDFLAVSHSNFVSIMYRFWDTTMYWSKLANVSYSMCTWCLFWHDNGFSCFDIRHKFCVLHQNSWTHCHAIRLNGGSLMKF